jgi:hypothetical protein
LVITEGAGIDVICLRRWRDDLPGGSARAEDVSQGFSFELTHHLSARQVDLVLAGGQIARLRREVDSG